MKRFTTLLLWLFAGLAAQAVQAAPLTPAELPAALRDWLPWAQQGQPPLRSVHPAPPAARHTAVRHRPRRAALRPSPIPGRGRRR